MQKHLLGKLAASPRKLRAGKYRSVCTSSAQAFLVSDSYAAPRKPCKRALSEDFSSGRLRNGSRHQLRATEINSENLVDLGFSKQLIDL